MAVFLLFLASSIPLIPAESWSKEAAIITELRLDLEKREQELVMERYTNHEELKNWQLVLSELNRDLKLADNRQKLLKKELLALEEKEKLRNLSLDEEREEWLTLISNWQKELIAKRCFGHLTLKARLNELSDNLRQKEFSPSEAAYLLSSLLLEFHQKAGEIYAGLEPIDIGGKTILAEVVNFGDTLLYYRNQTHYGFLYHDKNGCHREELAPEAAAERRFIDQLLKLCQTTNCRLEDHLLLPSPNKLATP